MNARKLPKADKLQELYDKINRQLDLVGIESQPAVAARLVELVQNASAGPIDFSKTIRNDPALCGRLLKLANSAAFAQLREVTSVDRACMLLGQERLRSISLGFYLSRSATDPEHEDLSRRIWGESVLRGCIAAELARETNGAGVAEAFLVGLLLDAGVPVMNRLLRQRYALMTDADIDPSQRFRLELESLPMTHVDVGAALCKRWQLPELLSKPIAWHHTPPPPTPAVTPVQRMQRIAYCVGLIGLSKGVGVEAFEHEARARLGLKKQELDDACARARSEYQVTIDVFDSVAQRSPRVSELMDMVHQRLIDAHDDELVRDVTLGLRTQEPAPRFTLGGTSLEIERVEADIAVAYLVDENGGRLAAHHFVPGSETAASISAALAIVPAPGDDSSRLDEHLSALAA